MGGSSGSLNTNSWGLVAHGWMRRWGEVNVYNRCLPRVPLACKQCCFDLLKVDVAPSS